MKRKLSVQDRLDHLKGDGGSIRDLFITTIEMTIKEDSTLNADQIDILDQAIGELGRSEAFDIMKAFTIATWINSCQ